LAIATGAEKPLMGRLAIVTGGGRGIGRATAIRLAETGCDLAIAGRTESYLIYTADKIRALGRDCLWAKADISKADDVKNFVDQVVTAFRRIDILVNNAGVSIVRPVFELTEAEWDSVVDGNLKSVFLMCKAVLPSMLSQGSGTIVNVASAAGKMGAANLSAYSAAKAGVMRFSESLGREVGPRGIRVYGVCPTAVDTELHAHLPAWQRSQMLKPADVAERILQLCVYPTAASGTCIDIAR